MGADGGCPSIAAMARVLAQAYRRFGERDAAGTVYARVALALGESEEALRAFAADDPVVTTGTARFELGRMLAGFVRP